MTTTEIKLFRIALGALVVHLRKEHEMTQETLGARLGINQSSVAKIEAGRNGLAAEKYNVLARVFGMTLDKFHNRVQLVIDETRLAAEAIRPGALFADKLVKSESGFKDLIAEEYVQTPTVMAEIRAAAEAGVNAALKSLSAEIRGKVIDESLKSIADTFAKQKRGY